ncbi:hypothetical protein CYMTET_33661 [Cymbomonas tetramitiformis]|uniref:Uncharacterized protein n=1 Tax=Cymbomonas tetramitiformis TaxID=36881 RepID=A0AAE0FCL2_9CHLO|nr:hypothetical protein CYMTET_33661 [Cymbomonas tetramitiformis]
MVSVYLKATRNLRSFLRHNQRIFVLSVLVVCGLSGISTPNLRLHDSEGFRLQADNAQALYDWDMQADPDVRSRQRTSPQSHPRRAPNPTSRSASKGSLKSSAGKISLVKIPVARKGHHSTGEELQEWANRVNDKVARPSSGGDTLESGAVSDRGPNSESGNILSERFIDSPLTSAEDPEELGAQDVESDLPAEEGVLNEELSRAMDEIASSEQHLEAQQELGLTFLDRFFGRDAQLSLKSRLTSGSGVSSGSTQDRREKQIKAETALLKKWEEGNDGEGDGVEDEKIAKGYKSVHTCLALLP